MSKCETEDCILPRDHYGPVHQTAEHGAFYDDDLEMPDNLDLPPRPEPTPDDGSM